ncbi:MAG: protein kinase [Proteobacteria bacterium]|nr:protein kinase [Pseudomonadota bacterium]
MSARPPPSRLLVVDNDTRYGEWLRHHLDVLCPQASVSLLNLSEFERWCGTFSGRDCDLLVLGAPFGAGPEDPQAHGLALLRKLRDQPAAPAIIVLAEDGNELTAVRALRLGAADYLPKRLLTPERLNTAVTVALRRVEKRVARRLASLALHSRAAAATAAADTTAGGSAVAAAAPATTATAGEEIYAAADAPGGNSVAAPVEEVFAAHDAADDPVAPGETELQPASVAALLAAANAEVIPGYTLRLKIGESEKAAVYLAHSAARGCGVALKVSKSRRDEAQERMLLEREYTAVMAVSSPLVVQIYDYGTHGGHEFLAMEYLQRGDLKARILRGVSLAQALHYVAAIAAALQVVHKAHLVHRDLKPPNVMLREDDSVALIDFGLARPLDGGTLSTRTGVLLGSPYYMSPEQALGETLDARSDFYSLGIICYEMLAGQKPYTGATAMEVLQQHVSSPLPELPATLQTFQPFLRRLLAKSRDERFADAAAVIAAVEELQRSTAIPVRAQTA